MSAIKTLIVDDEGLYRQMLVSILSTSPEIEIVGDASTGEESIELARELGPEVVLMDIELGPGISGIQAGQRIRTSSPTTGVVLLSYHVDKNFLSSTIAESAAGWSYLLKKNVRDTETVVRAIKGSAWGMVVVDPLLTEDLMPRKDTPLGSLGDVEMRVLELVAQGYTDEAIAERLNIVDEEAVEGFLGSIYRALGIEPNGEVDPRVKAVVAYLEQTRSS